MKRPGLFTEIAVLVVSNAFVLIHVGSNRSGTPDSEIQLTAREARYFGGGRENSSVTLMLAWQNPTQEYRYSGQPVQDSQVWFDAAKLKQVGFDLRVPAQAKEADRYYRNARSREVFVALEYDGPAWQNWLMQTGPPMYSSPPLSADRQLEIRRETDSRLVAIDAASSPDALREKYPDRKRVIILRGLARVVREETPCVRLRGAITRLAVDSIHVPQPISRQFDGQGSYTPWTMNGSDVKIQPLPYSVTLAIGSNYEPWVKDVKRLR